MKSEHDCIRAALDTVIADPDFPAARKPELIAYHLRREAEHMQRLADSAAAKLADSAAADEQPTTVH